LQIEIIGQNPNVAPASTTVSIALAVSPVISETKNKERYDMDDIPAARPSRPSIKLIALVTPTIHKQ